MTLSILLLLSLTPNSSNTFVATLKKAEMANAAEDWTAAEMNWKKLAEMAPGHPRVFYHLARVQAKQEKMKAARASLELAIDLGLAVDLEDALFTVIRDLPQFEELEKKNKDLKKPLIRSVTAFEIQEADLIPEGIAYDAEADVFYVGSIRKNKIVKVNAKGDVSAFATSEQDGLMGVVGMEVDAKRRLLWVCNGYMGPGSKGFSPDKDRTTALHLYDLNSGKLKKRFQIEGKGHYLNDLTVASNGAVYISDSETTAIYTAKPDSSELEIFLESPETTMVNGVTLSDDEKWLYVAAIDGLKAIDMETRKIHVMKAPPKTALTGIDGLYAYGQRLLAVQNGLNRTVAFELTPNGGDISRAQVLDFNHPQFSIPTTGAIAGEYFFLLANSQMDAMDKNGNLATADLKPITILKNSLGSRKTPPFVIDGVLNDAGWQVESWNEPRVVKREDADYVYFGIHSNILTTIHLYLKQGDEIHVLHASASLGRAVYRQEGETWKVTEKFVWEVRDPAIRHHFDLPMSYGDDAAAYLAKNQWLANTVLMGEINQGEFRISKDYLRKHGPIHAISFNMRNPETGKRQVAHYPKDAEIAPLAEEALLLRGETPEQVSFNPKGWDQAAR